MTTSPPAPEAGLAASDVCFFRHSSLLHLPEPWGAVLHHLGTALHDCTLELFGKAPAAPDSLETTRAWMLTIAQDLETAARELAMLDRAADEDLKVEQDARLCRLAGSLHQRIHAIAESLRRAALGRG